MAFLRLEGGELANYGPAKDPNLQGLDEFQKDMYGKEVEAASRPGYRPDPTGRRTGAAADPRAADALRAALAAAAEAVRPSLAAERRPLDLDAVARCLDDVRGAALMCHPEGLPPYDPFRVALEAPSSDAAEASPSYGGDRFDPDTAQLWYCGRTMRRGSTLADHVGRNDKTKVVVKLTAAGAQAPGREPPVDEATHRAMLAHHHKRQEEERRLAQADDEGGVGTGWADSKALKGALGGLAGGVRIR